MGDRCGRVSFATALLLTMLASSAASAQTQAAEASSAPQARDRIAVRIAGEKGELRGRLLRLDPKSVQVEIDDSRANVGPSRRVLDIPLDRVARIDREEHDSLIDGAILGALYVAACIRWWCGQGMNQAPNLPRDLWIGAALGAGLGAGLDSAFYHRTTIYPPPAPRLSLRFAIRF